MLFRKVLLFIKRQYMYHRARFFLYAIGAFILLAGISIGVDFLLPWEGLGMFLRVFILIPLGSVIFALGYAGALAYYFMRSQDEQWVSWRDKFSPTWRQRISMIVGAVLVVLIIATNSNNPGYTLVTSCIAAVIVGLFVFMRKTSSELRREELGIPDARDVVLNSHLQRKSASNANKKDNRKDKLDAKAQARVDKARAQLAAAEADLESSQDKN